MPRVSETVSEIVERVPKSTSFWSNARRLTGLTSAAIALMSAAADADSFEPSDTAPVAQADNSNAPSATAILSGQPPDESGG
jgi:hypothetical protein